MKIQNRFALLAALAIAPMAAQASPATARNVFCMTSEQPNRIYSRVEVSAVIETTDQTMKVNQVAKVYVDGKDPLAVSLPDTKEKTLTPEKQVSNQKFVDSFDLGWGVDGKANFSGAALFYDFGMIEDARGDSIGLLLPASFQSGKASIILYGNDQSSVFRDAECTITQVKY